MSRKLHYQESTLLNILDPVDKHQKNKNTKHTHTNTKSKTSNIQRVLAGNIVFIWLLFLISLFFFEGFWSPSFPESANIALSATRFR